MSRFYSVSLGLALSLSLAAVFFFALPAQAEDDNQAACLNKQSGDSCTRPDGSIDACTADLTTPGVLTCGLPRQPPNAGGNSGTAGATGIPSPTPGPGGTSGQAGSVAGPTCTLTPSTTAPRPPNASLAPLALAAALAASRRATRGASRER
jgi:hypothetical protein